MPKIKVINNYKNFENIRTDWEILVNERIDNVSVFGSYAWYDNWWHHYSNGATLNVVTMWASNMLVGVMPLVIRRSTRHGFPINTIDFIENRNSPHNDFIVLPDSRVLFLREVLRVLFKQSAQWDVFVLNNIPVYSPNRMEIVNVLDETGRKWKQEPTYNSPYLNLSGSWMEYFASRTSRTRKSLRNIQNSIAKAGEISVRNIHTWEEYQNVREDVYQVAKQSWTGKIGDSLATPTNCAFFDDLARTAAEKGWLSVWTLQLNGKIIAFEYHLKAFGKEHAMRGSYLPEYASLSPGTFLEMQILKNIFEDPERPQIYDFGGGFDNYKRKWTDKDVPHCAIMVFNDRMYSRFVTFHETKTVPLVKRVRDKMKRFRS